MNLMIDFTPEQAARLTSAAKGQGLDSQAILKRLVTDYLPEPPECMESMSPPGIDAENAAAIAYLKRRLREEATDDPELIRQAEQDVEELKRALNANRAATGERLVAP